MGINIFRGAGPAPRAGDGTVNQDRSQRRDAHATAAKSHNQRPWVLTPTGEIETRDGRELGKLSDVKLALGIAATYNGAAVLRHPRRLRPTGGK